MSGEAENPRVLTVYYTYPGGRGQRPLIRLQGKWLEDLGFQSGNKVVVEEHSGVLLIKAATNAMIEKEKAGSVR
ncbi:SymE family type I addiction module toxin [Acetonema longum]|uniref:Toxin SymE-like domain-containing protein n=1 Tax=Acetonema longum DSM 6540 TaxID=1009370 RepID=F7NGG3_9FIRM|nr:SymE family type I addiction module toxin [Acetonema longum]EGO64767.1 hypothetical protein ALO_05755 [Acetonema longum DSM 6540]